MASLSLMWCVMNKWWGKAAEQGKKIKKKKEKKKRLRPACCCEYDVSLLATARCWHPALAALGLTHVRSLQLPKGTKEALGNPQTWPGATGGKAVNDSSDRTTPWESLEVTTGSSLA